MQRKAVENVQEVYNRLEGCMELLRTALDTAEKQDNKQRIRNTLGALDNAIEVANHTLANFEE